MRSKCLIAYLTVLFALFFGGLLSCDFSGGNENPDLGQNNIQLVQTLQSQDQSSDAEIAGYPSPDVTVQGVDSFTLQETNDSTIVTNISQITTGTTDAGTLTLAATLSSSISGTVDVYLWINGQQSLICRNATAGYHILSSIVIGNGNNYICLLLHVNGSLWGRSPIVLVSSNIAPSLRRFELTWDGTGDLDLHIDEQNESIHVYYAQSSYNIDGFNIDLDVDNTTAFGPENIRIYDVPTLTTFRCYVNYYSSSMNAESATVRVFDQDNTLLDIQTNTFTSSYTGAGSTYNSKSWLVGEYSVSP